MAGTYSIHRSSMIAGIMIENGIRNNTCCITESSIGSPRKSKFHENTKKNAYENFQIHYTVVDYAHSHPILLCHVIHFDMDSVLRVQLDRYDVVVLLVPSDYFHPIQLNHFGCVDNVLVLADLIDNIPVFVVDKFLIEDMKKQNKI